MSTGALALREALEVAAGSPSVVIAQNSPMIGDFGFARSHDGIRSQPLAYFTSAGTTLRRRRSVSQQVPVLEGQEAAAPLCVQTYMDEW